VFKNFGFESSFENDYVSIFDFVNAPFEQWVTFLFAEINKLY